MVIYMRNPKTRTNYYEVEFYDKDKYIELHATVYSTNCFKLILEKYDDKEYINKFIEIFDFLEELRGWYYEIFLQQNRNITYSELLKVLRKMLGKYAEELGFCLVED